MRRPLLCHLPIAGLAAALLCAPAAAVAQEPAQPLGLVTSDTGRDVVAFSMDPPDAILAAERADGSFAAVEQVWPGVTGTATFALRGGDEVVGGWEAYTFEDSRGGPPESLGGALFAGPHGARLGPARRLFAGRPAGLRLAANRRGDAAALIGSQGGLAYLLRRPSGGAFRRPDRPIAGLDPREVAVTGDGSTVVAGAVPGAGGIRAATAGPGEPLGEAQTIDPGAAPSLVLAGGPGASAALAWAGADGALRLARRSPQGGPFGPPIVLASGGSLATGPLGVAVDPAGGTLVVWVQNDGDGPDARRRVRAAAVDPAGRVGEATWLSPPDVDLFYRLAQVAGNDRGDVVVTWQQQRPPASLTDPEWRSRPEQVAVVGTTAGRFGPPVVLSSDARGPEPEFFASMAASGRATVLWADTPRGVYPDDYDERLLVSRLDAGAAAPPVVIGAPAQQPEVMRALRPPLSDARPTLRRARVAPSGRLSLRVRARAWAPRSFRATVHLRLGGRDLARDSFQVAPGKTAVVRLRLRPAARRLLRRRGRLEVRAAVTTPQPQGVTRRRTMTLTWTRGR